MDMNKFKVSYINIGIIFKIIFLFFATCATVKITYDKK